MPRPPILDPVDYRALFKKGLPYTKWLKGEEEAKNAAKMEEIRKATPLTPSQIAWLKSLDRTVHVIAIAEGWCGDVIRHAPMLMRLANESPKLKVSFIERATDKSVFSRFLTNGGEAIPKFVFFNDKFVECGNWGPMPDECRRLISRGKAAGDVAAARKRVALQYESDPNGEIVIRELLALMETASCRTP